MSFWKSIAVIVCFTAINFVSVIWGSILAKRRYREAAEYQREGTSAYIAADTARMDTHQCLKVAALSIRDVLVEMRRVARRAVPGSPQREGLHELLASVEATVETLEQLVTQAKKEAPGP